MVGPLRKRNIFEAPKKIRKAKLEGEGAGYGLSGRTTKKKTFLAASLNNHQKPFGRQENDVAPSVILAIS